MLLLRDIPCKLHALWSNGTTKMLVVVVFSLGGVNDLWCKSSCPCLVGTPSGALASYSSGGGYSSSLSLSQGGGTKLFSFILTKFCFSISLSLLFSVTLSCLVVSCHRRLNLRTLERSVYLNRTFELNEWDKNRPQARWFNWSSIIWVAGYNEVSRITWRPDCLWKSWDKIKDDDTLIRFQTPEFFFALWGKNQSSYCQSASHFQSALSGRNNIRWVT